MSTVKDNPLNRLSFSLNGLELFFSVFTGVATWFGLKYFLHSTLPFPCGSSINNTSIDCGWTKQQAWEAFGYPLFSTYAIPLVLFLAISAIFLVRSIRKNNRHHSTLANLSFSFPIVAFLSFVLLSVFSLILHPIGLILAIITAIEPEKEKRYRWDWVALPFNMVWLVTFSFFISQFLSSYGD